MKRGSWPIYKCDHFLLSVRKRKLTSNGEYIPLTPKAFEILLMLMENRGRILTKQEMMEHIWPDTLVEEGCLTQNIFILRRALGENATGIQYIQTVRHRGYRFIAPVAVYEEEGSAPAIILPSSLSTIAVLPFDLLTPGEEEEYLGLGLADALITKFSNLSQITVRPTSSVRKYVNAASDPVHIGMEMKVDSVLMGSFQKMGDRFRATVQLVSVPEGIAVWSDKFDDVFTDVFTVQDMISERVARAFLLTLNGQEEEHQIH